MKINKVELIKKYMILAEACSRSGEYVEALHSEIKRIEHALPEYRECGKLSGPYWALEDACLEHGLLDWRPSIFEVDKVAREYGLMW